MKARAKPRELSPEMIRVAALALIDREGLDGLSMRKLGAALGCEGMALYYYYASKDELLDAVVDELMSRVVLREDVSWVDALRSVASAYRQIAHEHPNAFPLLATRRFATDGTYAFLEQLFALARSQGVDDQTVARFYRVVSSYCNGFALHELAAPAPKALRKKYATVADVSAWLDPEHLDDIFEFGLELQLDALRKATQGARGARAR